MNEAQQSAEARRNGTDAPRPPEIAGKWIVLGVLGFAVLMTSAMWVYWKLHVGPFLPLQRALVAEWPDSAPRVEGGQRKMHKGTPRILRATLKVPFDPKDDARKAELERRVARIRELAADTLDIATYDTLEVHFFHPVPEDEIRMRTFEVDLGAGSVECLPDPREVTPVIVELQEFRPRSPARNWTVRG